MNGHSFYIGGTTHLLLIGVDHFIVMVQGCGKSMTFLEYWCLYEEIIPEFIGLSMSSKSSIRSPMTGFKQWLLTCLWFFVGSLARDDCSPNSPFSQIFMLQV